MSKQSQNKTIQNVQVLLEARDAVKEILKDKYEDVIFPLITTIEMVMKSNDENHFSAVKRIQETTNLMDTKEKTALYGAALYEIIEEINLKPLK